MNIQELIDSYYKRGLTRQAKQLEKQLDILIKQTYENIDAELEKLNRVYS